MAINKNKISAIAIVLILTLSMSVSMILTPNVSAHSSPWQIPTYAYIVAEPNPVGVNQSVNIYMWLDAIYGVIGGATAAVNNNASTAAGALLANNYRFHDYKLTITGPQGTITQSFPVVLDTTSNQYTSFVPTVAGTYTLTFSYPGQVYGENGNGYEGSIQMNDTYLPSNATTTIQVQQTPIALPVTSEPLPTDYWTTPIYGQNTNWYTISNNWLGTGTGTAPGEGTGNGSPSVTSGNPVTPNILYNPDAIGPQTCHIMWTNPLQFGGLTSMQFSAGGSYPSGAATGTSYFEGTAYQNRFVNPIIMDGYLYYTEPIGFTGATSGPTVCVNLYTGKTLWSSSSVPPLLFGYIYNLWDPDQHGTFPPILVANNALTGNWEFFDAYTGLSLFNVTNLPPSWNTLYSGASQNVLGPNGEVLKYIFTNCGSAANPQWYLAQWNSSRLWQTDVNPYTGGGSLSPDIINMTNGLLVPVLPIPLNGGTGTFPNGTTSPAYPYGSVLTVNGNVPINGVSGPQNSQLYPQLTTYDWNISTPLLNNMVALPTLNAVTGLPVNPTAPNNCPVQIVAVKYGDLMLCRNSSLPVGYSATNKGFPQLPYTYFALNLNSSVGSIGSLLWTQTYNPPSGNLTLAQGPVDFTNNVFTIDLVETMQMEAFSMTTGNYLWTTQPQNNWDYYGAPGLVNLPCVFAYGNLYCSSFAGVCYCYDETTGALKWTYGNGVDDNSTNAGYATPYGNYPTMPQAVANGVVYLATEEHTIPDPIYKGCALTALNATTGQQLFSLSMYDSGGASLTNGGVAIANGYLMFDNGYDNNIYSIGRGPSVTTVQAPQTGITAGNGVVIQGTVMDTSTGVTQPQQIADFPQGLPCASDASMSQWMSYVYQQQAMPTNFTGVTVSLTAIDPNGNSVNIGTATTDANGVYSYIWTPPNVPGGYTITATFAGTNGYWPSHAESTMSVVEVPTPTTTIIAQSNLVTTSDLLMYLVAATIAIIIAIALVGLLLFRKRP
jgi:hypothetical protein